MKHYTHKLTALLLAALIMVSPVAQYLPNLSWI